MPARSASGGRGFETLEARFGPQYGIRAGS